MLIRYGSALLSIASPIHLPVKQRRIPVISYVQAGQMTAMRTPSLMGDIFAYVLTDLGLWA